MKFSDDYDLEALVGKVCLVFARVEQEAGHVVMAAHGNWDLAMSADYLAYSSNSGLLLDWLREVGRVYPEVKDDLSELRTRLKDLRKQRDQWAHSAAVIDLWLMMKEKGLKSMSHEDVDHGKLLNGKQEGHIDAPSRVDVEEFVKRASEVGDACVAHANKLASLAQDGIRLVEGPKRAGWASPEQSRPLPRRPIDG